MGTWSWNATLLPHPINFLAFETTDSVGSVVGNCMNTQITGLTHTDKMQTFLELARRWRLAYMSVTVVQDGPDLANQGTIVSCQTPLIPASLGFSHVEPGTQWCTCYNIGVYAEDDVPNFDNMQAVPNAYFNRSREGLYMPLRLTETCQDWHSMHDLTFQFFDLVHSDTVIDQSFGRVLLPPNTQPGSFPHHNIDAVYYDSVTHDNGGHVTSPLCNDVAGQIAVRNVAVGTGFSFFVRAGFEVQVRPGSLMSCHLKTSPPHDAVALATYFAISRELKDGYPAEYNELGKIWDVVSSIAKKVIPFISAVPVYGPAISAAAGSVVAAGDVIRAATSTRRANREAATRVASKKNPSATDIATAVEMVKAAPPARTFRVKTKTAKRLRKAQVRRKGGQGPKRGKKAKIPPEDLARMKAAVQVMRSRGRNITLDELIRSHGY